MFARYVKAILQAGSAVIGKVIVDNTVKTEIQSGSAVMGKVALVDSAGDPLDRLDGAVLPGEAYMGRTGGTLKWVLADKPLAAAGDYAAEDVVSENATAGTVWTFDGVCRIPGKGGYITSAVAVTGLTAIAWRLTLYLYKANPACVKNDNVANTGPALVDLPHYLGKIDFPVTEDQGGMSDAQATPNVANCGLPLAYDAPEGKLYGILVTRDAVTGESAGMRQYVGLGLDQY